MSTHLILPPDRPPTRDEINYGCALERPARIKGHALKLLVILPVLIALGAAVFWVVTE